jgi:histidinol-phosphatase (PHP family)
MAILYDTHMHTPLCKHATGLPQEYAKVAQQKGLKGIIVTCHNPVPGKWGNQWRMDVGDFPRYVDMVAQATEIMAGQVDVRLGIESDYAPGFESWLEELHAKAKLHYILGSVHPQMNEYKERYWKGSVIEFQRMYYSHLAMAAESGLFDCLAHPDIVKILHPKEWNVAALMDDIKRSLDRIAKTGIAMELNTSGLNKSYPEMNPGVEILHEMFARNIPVVVGSDSHESKRVGADFVKALEILEGVGYTTVNIFLDRTQQSIDLREAKESLINPAPQIVYA